MSYEFNYETDDSTNLGGSDEAFAFRDDFEDDAYGPALHDYASERLVVDHAWGRMLVVLLALVAAVVLAVVVKGQQQLIDEAKAWVSNDQLSAAEYTSLVNRYHALTEFLQLFVICGVGLWAISMFASSLPLGRVGARMQHLNRFTYSTTMFSSVAMLGVVAVLYWSFFEMKGVEVSKPWEIDAQLVTPVLFTLFTAFVLLLFPLAVPVYPSAASAFAFLYSVVFGYLVVYMTDYLGSRVVSSDVVPTDLWLAFGCALFVAAGVMMFLPMSASTGIVLAVMGYMLATFLRYSVDEDAYYATIAAIMAAYAFLVAVPGLRIDGMAARVLVSLLAGGLVAGMTLVVGVAPGIGPAVGNAEVTAQSLAIRTQIVEAIPQLSATTSVLSVAAFFGVLYTVWDLH